MMYLTVPAGLEEETEAMDGWRESRKREICGAPQMRVFDQNIYIIYLVVCEENFIAIKDRW